MSCSSFSKSLTGLELAARFSSIVLWLAAALFMMLPWLTVTLSYRITLQTLH